MTLKCRLPKKKVKCGSHREGAVGSSSYPYYISCYYKSISFERAAVLSSSYPYYISCYYISISFERAALVSSSYPYYISCYYISISFERAALLSRDRDATRFVGGDANYRPFSKSSGIGAR